MSTQRSRLRPGDLVALAGYGLRAHPIRAVLSALGIAIGIAAMVAVVGLATSSQARLRAQLSDLGTNLLTVTAGNDLFGRPSELDPLGPERVARILGVEHVAWIGEQRGALVYRSALVDAGENNSLTVQAASGELLETTGTRVAVGDWLAGNEVNLPVVVLGATAAKRLGIDSPGELVFVDGEYLTVRGILARAPLVPDLNTMVFVTPAFAERAFGFEGNPTTVFERSSESRVGYVRKVLPATLNPKEPIEVKVSRPSDALAAANTVDQTFTGLLVGVGSIAVLVGGIGVANTMVISVLERRREIGLRRALGATRGHILQQFLLEAVLLAAYGGIAGTLLGWLITAIVARGNGWFVEIPMYVPVAGVLVTIVVGAIAGILPAIRAARTSPTAALQTA